MGYKYFYTLDEICGQYVNPITHNSGSTEFSDVASNIIWNQAVPGWTSTQGADYEYLEEIWLRVRSMFQRDNTYFWVSDYDFDDEDDLVAECKNKLYDLYNTFYITKDKYIALIQAQEDLKSDILKDVENLNETWFNDTPQTSGDYTDLNYASNYTRNKNSISLGPVSLKLEEVDKAMNDIYDRWVLDFKKFRIFD